MKKIAIVIILCLIVLFGFIFFKSENDNNQTKEYTSNEYENKVLNLNDKILSGITKEEIREMTGVNFDSRFILIGSDSYLRQSIKTKSDISEYEESMNLYAGFVEEAIKNNFESNVEETITSVEGDVVVRILFKTYYYNLYLYDLDLIMSKILNSAGYDNKKPEDEKKYNLDEFKAKVKAMEILNDHLNEYQNNYEYFNTEIIFKNGNLSSRNSYIESYLLVIDGSLSKNIDFGNKDYLKQRENLVETYISSAISSGTYDENNPLKLK